ncbi:MAG TPA: GntR family transcriptional regulator [Amycolatopsis sp.]|nr:GntR family transcriptional regulator [Amycolatopsis sp.]
MTTRPAPVDSPGVDPVRVTPRARIVDQVVHQLREAILNHEIPPGSRLIQLELADRLGVSRTPLREALRLLEQDGLVQVSDRNRTVEVVQFSRRDFIELYAVREVIDGLAARTLASRGMDEDTEKIIGGHLAAMEAASKPLRGEDYVVAHVGFHAAIIEHCGNSRLASQLPLVRITAAALRDEWPRHLRQRSRTSEADGLRAVERTHQEHVRIFDAIRNGDPDEAERVARAHIVAARAFFPGEDAALTDSNRHEES